MHVAHRQIVIHVVILLKSFNSTADCGAPPPPVNGSLLQSYTNTTEGSVVVFQCDPGFVPEGEMTAVCGNDGQWTPNSGGVTCSLRPTQTFTQTFTQAPTKAPTLASTGTWMSTGYGESELQLNLQRFLLSLVKIKLLCKSMSFSTIISQKYTHWRRVGVYFCLTCI